MKMNRILIGEVERMKCWTAIVTVLTLLMMLLLSGGAAAEESAGAPDLIVTALTWSGGDGQVEPGTALTFSVTVKNQGTAAVDAPFTVDIAFGQEQLFRLTHAGGLAVGAEATLTSPAWTAVSGDRMISARVNSTGTVTEVVERWDNDVLQLNLRVANDRYAPAYDTVRAAVEEAGMYDLTFNDDFNDTVAFDANKTGKEGYKWYCRRHSAFPTLDMAECRTENGILTMDCKIDTFALGAATIDRVTGVGYTFTHGYIEFRLRMPVVGGEDESKTAIWSFPRERYTEKEKYTTHVEMDWMEYYGDNYYTVTLHEMTYEGSKRHWYSSDGGNFNGLGDQQWHTMGYLWEEGSLRCYLDGKLFLTQTWSPDDVPMPINVVKDGDIKFDGVFSYADTQDMMLFIFGSKKIPLELDYVRIWQEGGDKPVVTPPTTTTTTTVAPKTTTAATVTNTTAKKPIATTATAGAPTANGAVTTVTEATTATTTVRPTETTAGTVATASPPTSAVSGDGTVPEAEGLPGWLIGVIVGTVVLLGGTIVLIVWPAKRKRVPKTEE